MANVRAELIVKGKVQKVGYRDYVQETARNLNVKGQVENLRDGSVRIVCEAAEDTIENFIKLVSVREDLVSVENVEIVKTEPATGEYEYFDVKYGPLEEEMGERMVAAFKIAVATRTDVKSMHQDLKGSIDSMHKDMKSMNRDLKGSIDSMHTDMKGMGQDLKGSIDSMHKDMKSMNQDLKGSIDSMHTDMNRHFEEMAKRYDAISAELLGTREELKRAVDSLVKLIQKFLEKPA